jgi:2-phospho-L-lactate/phosphoenolpyruvate guanylyltransferase
VTARGRRAAAAPWAVVLPVRSFTHAKSSLAAQSDGHHAALAHAFYLDTLRAVRATPGVGIVVVVTSDPLAASQARILGAVTVAEQPGGAGAAGVEGAALRGIAALTPGAPAAVLVADLPALRPEELHLALTAAGGHRRAFVPDRGGAGTTAVLARRAADLRPTLGPGSRQRNLAAGAFEIGLPPSCGLRLDVDTPADLAAARSRGLGLYSAAVPSLWAGPRRPRAMAGVSAP